jgi:hypothetical protein
MGFDLMRRGISLSLNWSDWRAAVQVAKAYGWEPQGTLQPSEWIDDGCGWSVGYFSSDGQVVAATDAVALGDALERALPDIPVWDPDSDLESDVSDISVGSRYAKTMETAEKPTALLEFAGKRGSLREIADFCQGGQFYVY